MDNLKRYRVLQKRKGVLPSTHLILLPFQILADLYIWSLIFVGNVQLAILRLSIRIFALMSNIHHHFGIYAFFNNVLRPSYFLCLWKFFFYIHQSFECLPFRMDDASNADELFASHYIPSYTQLMMLFDSTHKEGKAHDGCTKQRDDGLPNDCLSSLDDPCAGRMCVSISRRRDTTEKERQCMCSTGENSRTATKSECKRSLLPLEMLSGSFTSHSGSSFPPTRVPPYSFFFFFTVTWPTRWSGKVTPEHFFFLSVTAAYHTLLFVCVCV